MLWQMKCWLRGLVDQGVLHLVGDVSTLSLPHHNPHLLLLLLLFLLLLRTLTAPNTLPAVTELATIKQRKEFQKRLLLFPLSKHLKQKLTRPLRWLVVVKVMLRQLLREMKLLSWKLLSQLVRTSNQRPTGCRLGVTIRR